MLYCIGFLIIGVVGGLLLWMRTKRIKYVIIFSIFILLMLILPFILLWLAFAFGADLPD